MYAVQVMRAGHAAVVSRRISKVDSNTFVKVQCLGIHAFCNETVNTFQQSASSRFRCLAYISATNLQRQLTYAFNGQP